MKKTIVTIAALFLASCASTTVNYKTEKISTLSMNKSVGKGNLSLSSNAQLIDNPFSEGSELAKTVNKTLASEFNESFANASRKSKDFNKISVSLYHENNEDVVLISEVKVDPNPNFFTGLCTILTLGIIPHYIEVDYNVNCELQKNGKSYYYQFTENTSSWQGLFVVGKGVIEAEKETKSEVYENISRNLLTNLRRDNIIKH